MYSRNLPIPLNQSFFLFGPRGTGKSTWIRSALPSAILLDLLDSATYNTLLAAPQRLAEWVPTQYEGWIIIDEIQRVPALLNEVHRLIETKHWKFALTGSSARKLRDKGVNLLAGRALTRSMHPLTAHELGVDFSLTHALHYGLLPMACTSDDPADYLASYTRTYLREEVQQEGLVRNLQSFARFLETASFSQASLLNISDVARDAGVSRKAAEAYFYILEDLLLAHRLPVFSKKAKRRLVAHPKFYLFDAGVFRSLRPKGPLDRPEEIDGAALETLVFQELRATNDAFRLGYEIFYWRSATHLEVDFILYGERGLLAIEVKRANTIRDRDLSGLRAFLQDYPSAKAYLFYGGTEKRFLDHIECHPLESTLQHLPELL